MITKYKQTHGETIYVLVVNVQRELTEGFAPIKTLIYDIQILKIYRLYKLLVSMTVKPLGIKTDCIQIRESVKQLRKKATRANITSDVFKIKETQQTMPVKSSQVTADKIKKIVAELDNYKTITNERLGALLHPIFGKRVNKYSLKCIK